MMGNREIKITPGENRMLGRWSGSGAAGLSHRGYLGENTRFSRVCRRTPNPPGRGSRFVFPKI